MSRPTLRTAPWCALDGRAWFLALAGVLTWAAVGLPLWSASLQEKLLAGEPRVLAGYAFYVLFLPLFLTESLVLERPRFAGSRRRRGLALLLVAAETAAAAGVVLAFHHVTGAALLVITAAQVAGVLRLGPAMLWSAAQAVVPAIAMNPSYGIANRVMTAGVFLGFMIFATMITHAMAREAAAREALEEAYRELRATTALLEDSHRLAERMQIARELHDVAGHHLAALSLNLEGARHLAAGGVREKLDTCRDVAQSLLKELREVVGRLRDEPGLDLRSAIAPIVDAVPSPEISCDVSEELRVRDPAVGHALMRTVQEAVTNAARHSGARHLRIVLHREGESVRLRASDDGRGASAVREGHGLSGMRERIESLGGKLRVETAPGHGFAIEAEIPDDDSHRAG